MVYITSTGSGLNYYSLMEGVQRGAHAGCSGRVDNLLIDRALTLDCYRRKRNLSMGWINVKLLMFRKGLPQGNAPGQSSAPGSSRSV